MRSAPYISKTSDGAFHRGRRLLVGLGLCLLALAVSAPGALAAYGVVPGSLDLRFENADGSAAVQAGSHPYALTTTVEFNRTSGNQPDGNTKDVVAELPPGFVGDTTAYPRCALSDFLVVSSESIGSKCPDSTAIGVVYNTLETAANTPSPVFNLTPPPGVPLRFGFVVLGLAFVVADVTVKPGGEYNVVTHISGIPQTVGYFGTPRLTLWGNPSDPSHDAERGRCASSSTPMSCPTSPVNKPLLTLPTRCAGPQQSRLAFASWQKPRTFLEFMLTTHNAAVPPQPQGFVGCGKLDFSPIAQVRPTTSRATSGTGLDFDLDVNQEGLTSVPGLAQSDIEKVVVALPEGVSINPSQAEGLGTCSEADLARETASSEPGAGCPNESKIGTAEVESPLLGEMIDGALYVATPYENPEHSLIALYLVLQAQNSGLSVHIPVRVDTDPASGRITAVAEDLPQLPFGHFRLHFREGTRSPLVTPATCGTYATTAMLYPWSGTGPVESGSTFQITGGPESGPCPTSGAPPFRPGLGAGTLNNAAASYSPFNLQLSRNDAEQEMTHFSIKLPPGVTGKLAGIPFCSDAAIDAAKARTGPHGGREELEHPSCPAASEVGSTVVGVGVGSALSFVPGKVYLAGPYHGSNLSVVAITSGVVGPFDVGTVVIREALKVDPETAEVSVDAAGSDPLPHIIKGIPVHLRDIRVYVDRPQFVLNPTSCEPTSTASTVLGSGTNFATEADDRPVTVTTRFQAADCASLGFRPKLKLKLKGPTKRAGLPKLKAIVTARPGDANIGRAVVTLPKSEFLEQGHIGTVCTRVQFNAGGGNGEQCPARSVYGRAKAVTPLLDEPLSGPVFLRSNGGERRLPDLVAALHSKDIDIDLLGFIKSLHPKGSSVSRIRTIFASVPDAPVSRFTLEMFGGKKGLLVNSTNLCKGRHRAISIFVGQNGRRSETRPAVQVRCRKGQRKHRRRAGHGKKVARQKGGARLAVSLRHRLAW